MATPEVSTALKLFVLAVDRVFAAADGLDAPALNWRPAEDASPLSALGLHVIGMTRENVMTTICRLEDSDRVRAVEFSSTTETGASLAARWAALRPQIEAALAALPAGDLELPRVHHTWGEVSVREILLRMVTHAYEHAGQAELTRQLFEAQRAG
jgi:hypothetical protein